MILLILSLVFPVKAALFNDFLDVDPNDEGALRSAVTQGAQTGQKIHFTRPFTPPSRPASVIVRPFVTAKVTGENGKAITVDGAYRMRKEATASAGSLGKLVDARGPVTLNGRRAGDRKEWVGVKYNGQDVWVHQNALRGSHVAVATKPEATKTADKGPSQTAKVEKASVKPAGPTCVSDYQTAVKYPKFAEWVRQANPYTRWKGMMGSYVDVSTSGQAVLHHPLKGDMPAMASICISANGQHYVSVAGAAFSGRATFPNQSDLSTISINYEGTPYTFSAR